MPFPFPPPAVAASVSPALVRATTPAAAGTPRPATGFAPSLGLTRAQVESRFHAIDDGHTAFAKATKVKGVARVLGRDERRYALVEINGYPEVSEVQVVVLLDTSSASELQDQVEYGALACGEFGGKTAANWCAGRILDTNPSGLVTATTSKGFEGLEFTVRTYSSASKAGDSSSKAVGGGSAAHATNSPPVVSIEVAPA